MVFIKSNLLAACRFAANFMANFSCCGTAGGGFLAYKLGHSGVFRLGVGV